MYNRIFGYRIFKYKSFGYKNFLCFIKEASGMTDARSQRKGLLGLEKESLLNCLINTSIAD